MSLLDTANEEVVVYLEETTTDADGNTITKPSATCIETRARIQPVGTPTEEQDSGYQTASRYRLRFPRSWPHVLGAQSQIEWNGKRWSMIGDLIRHNGSARTRHVHYVIERR
ncbi:hypothetical protein DQP55_04175 [Mycolicibacterium sp. GF69]|uniref:hypothetical protein n=1 Tax=Mycolicibacterium sp. GF69 TaxID=2267251 RepID=UPI000DCC2D2E|nr:hypothetical protein [Mycolicibacterium sp. GF69]RAV17188.1 hypothetical protein DQP55_04175 [Mycolicibacterium sp. GF69]